MHYSFDFDYTLADSSSGTVACATYALEELGLELPAPEAIKKTIGLSLERTFETLTGDVSTDLAASFKGLFLEHAQEVMLSHISFYTHTRPLLEGLNRNGHYVSIVSTKLRARIDEALARDGLTHLVKDVVGGGCVQNNKPNPEGLLRAIEVSCIPKSETVYVGDSVSDGECAQRAGVGFVGVSTGTTPTTVLEVWQPVQILSHAGELLD